MSTDPADMQPTSALPEHALLKKFIGEWQVSQKMAMPEMQNMDCEGKETITQMGDLWVLGEGHFPAPNGEPTEYRNALGYDVTFKQYRGCWIMAASSHLWVSQGQANDSGTEISLDCVGPDMESDGTANYRDVVQFSGENDWVRISYSQDKSTGQFVEFMRAIYKRA